MDEIISPKNPALWRKCMKAFRKLLEESMLSKKQQRLCTGVLGRHLKGRTRGYGLKLYEKLKSRVERLKVPGWAKTMQELARWFAGLLKGLFRPKRRPRQFRDYNEQVHYLAELEKERVMRRRAEYQPTLKQSWDEWHLKQEAERAWKIKRAELARQTLREEAQRGKSRSPRHLGPLRS